MDILIKSFNRPYYLDKCLYSIKRYAKGYRRIVIVDDGTPDIYLEKITAHHPEVEIIPTELSELKSRQIQLRVKDRKTEVDKTVPTSDWRRAIEGLSDYFLLLEDDIWLKGHVDLENYASVMQSVSSPLMKLAWWGSEKMIAATVTNISNGVELLKNPHVKYKNPYFFRLITTKKYKLFGIARLLKLIYWHDFLEYYTYYVVAGGIYKKSFWLEVFVNAGKVIFEPGQLGRSYFLLKTRKQGVCKPVEEKINTSFTTSVSNHIGDESVDFILLNTALNNAWLQGKLNSQDNLAQDFDFDLLCKLVGESGFNINLKYYKNWVENFKNLYRGNGYQI